MAEDNANERKLVTVFLRNALGGIVPGEKRGLSFSSIQIYSCFWPMVTFIFQPVLSSFHGEFLQKRATCVHRTRNPTNKPVQCRAASQVLRCSKFARVSLYGSSATGKWMNGRKKKPSLGVPFSRILNRKVQVRVLAGSFCVAEGYDTILPPRLSLPWVKIVTRKLSGKSVRG